VIFKVSNGRREAKPESKGLSLSSSSFKKNEKCSRSGVKS